MLKLHSQQAADTEEAFQMCLSVGRADAEFLFRAGVPARRPEAADTFPLINEGARSASSSRTVSPPAADHLPASNGASPAAPGSSAREAFPSLGQFAASARQRNLRSWGPGEYWVLSCCKSCSVAKWCQQQTFCIRWRPTCSAKQ